MKFTIIKTLVTTKKELYEVNIADHLDPLVYVGVRTPISTLTEREVQFDVFKRGVKE